MNKLSLHKFALLLFFIAFFTKCSDENAFQDLEKANISVKLFDAPGDYEKVYVEVVDVLLLVIDDKTISNCWLSLNAKAGVYDLLDLTGGVEALLVDNLSIPTGMIYEIYLVLGDNNSIVTNGRTLPLFMPNALQKGLQIRVDQDLKPNLSYTFLLDFDVDQSILNTNTPDYIVLKPVIRSSMEVLSGSISGKISNTFTQTQVSLITNTERITTFTDTEGNFLLRGIPEGNYTIQITPDSDLGYAEVTVENIIAVNGSVTDIGDITLE